MLTGRPQGQQLLRDGGQAEAGDLLDLSEGAAVEDPDPRRCAQDRARDRADRVRVAAQIRGIQEGARGGVAREQCEGHGNRLRRGHGGADLLGQQLRGW